MKITWEIEEAVDGYRVNIWPEDVTKPIYKINPETRLEALSAILHNVQYEIKREEQALKNAAELSL